jgi:chromosomal replication initiation ATPase DnaA
MADARRKDRTPGRPDRVLRRVTRLRNPFAREDAMKFQFSSYEADFLASQLRRDMQRLERELIRTDKRELRHALALDLEVLEQIVMQLEFAEGSAAGTRGDGKAVRACTTSSSA